MPNYAVEELNENSVVRLAKIEAPSAISAASQATNRSVGSGWKPKAALWIRVTEMATGKQHEFHYSD